MGAQPPGGAGFGSDDADDLLDLIAPGALTHARDADNREEPDLRASRSRVAEPPVRAEETVWVAEAEPVAEPGPVPGAFPSVELGVGVAFYPLAHVPPVGPAVDGSSAGELWTEAGAFVHAISSGRVVATDTAGIELLSESGLRIRYSGLAGEHLAVAPGVDVLPGQALGRLGGRPGTAACLRLEVIADDGGSIDAAALIVGLADPAELGTSDAGPARDPDAVDRALGASASRWVERGYRP